LNIDNKKRKINERKSEIPIELHGFYKKGEKERLYRRPHHDVQGNDQLTISKCVQRKDLIFQNSQ